MSGGRKDQHRVYTASKTRHADLWLKLRACGVDVSSTWIDEAGEQQTEDYAELSMRCLWEVAGSSAFVMYVESGEILKGALVELGVALFLKLPVLCLYTEPESPSISRVFRRHPCYREILVGGKDEVVPLILRLL